MSEKNYVKGMFIKESKYGLKVSCNLPLLIPFLESIQNSKGYANIEISKKREVGKYGDTHYAIEDDWKPDPNYKKPEPEQQVRQGSFEPQAQSNIDDDLPFN